jgi:hypothetical protein
MANNTNAQGYRYQQHVSKRKLLHAELEKAYGPNWAEKYRADGQRIAAEKKLLQEQAHQAAVAGAAPDEDPAVAAGVDQGIQGTVDRAKAEQALDQAADSANVEMVHAANEALAPKA